VYKGVLLKSNLEIAVQQVSHDSKQGMKEFIAEVVNIGRAPPGLQLHVQQQTATSAFRFASRRMGHPLKLHLIRSILISLCMIQRGEWFREK
jgi:hypothetical protein